MTIRAVKSVGNEWESFNGAILRRILEVRGLRTVGAGRRKASGAVVRQLNIVC